MIQLSGIIIAKNEEEMIADAIDSLHFCDEVLVIDNGSTDRTVEIATLLKAKVISSNAKEFSALRNFGQEKAKGKWLLYLDADERVSSPLQEEIKKVIQKKHPAAAYRVPRKNYYYGDYMWPITEKLERLFQKSQLEKWTGELHESPVVNGAVLNFYCACAYLSLHPQNKENIFHQKTQ